MKTIFAMKTFVLAVSFLSAASLCGCGGSGEAGRSQDAGSGVLAPLSGKYIEIAGNRLESEKALKELEASGFDEAAQKKADKIINELNQKNDALEAEAKSVAEGLKGKNIACTTSDATGLTDVECTVYGVKASSKSANVVLAFTSTAPMDKDLGCLFLDESGQTLNKMKAFANGDGTIGVIYMITTKDDAESARIASRVASISLVTGAEYEAASITGLQD